MRVRRFVPVVGLLLACGRTALDAGSGDGEGEGASSSGAMSNGAAASSGGADATGGTKVTGGATNRGGSGPSPMGGAAQAGGGQGGGGGASSDSLFLCSTPYAGPTGGPRFNGPALLRNGCENVSDDVLLARSLAWEARVPYSLYYEPPDQLISWGPGCSQTPEETADYAGTDRGKLVGQHSSPYFFEAEFCSADGVRSLYRQIDCAYFNGQQFPNHTLEDFAFLSSLLWWQSNYNISGHAILGYSVGIGNATDSIELCTITTSQGDFGLCDEIALQRTQHLLMFDGQVRLGEPEEIRTVMGECR